MIDVFDIWEKFVSNANVQQGGQVKPERTFANWLHDISLELYEEKFSDWEKSQKILDDLSRPFLVTANMQVADVSGANYGVAAFPDDYGHYSTSRYYTYNGKGVPIDKLPFFDCNGNLYEGATPPASLDPEVWALYKGQVRASAKKAGIDLPVSLREEHPVDKVSNASWGSVIKHRFNGARKDRIKITQFEGGIKVAPAGVGVIVVDYLKKPTKPSFAYTVIPGDPITGQGDVIVYDKAKSKPLEWSELVLNEFLIRLDKKYGKRIREAFIWQTSEHDRNSTI
jgi:hypothetical protein